MSQRKLDQAANSSAVSDKNRQLKLDSSIDLELLDDEMKSKLVSNLLLKVGTISLEAKVPFDAEKLTAIEVDQQILILAKRLRMLNALLERRKSIQLESKQENALKQKLNAQDFNTPVAETPVKAKAPEKKILPEVNKAALTAEKKVSKKKVSTAKPFVKVPKPAKTKNKPLFSTLRKLFSIGKLSAELKVEELAKETNSTLNAPIEKITPLYSNVALEDNDTEVEEGKFFSLDKHYLESLKRRPQVVHADSVIDIEIAALKDMSLVDVHLVCRGGQWQPRAGVFRPVLVKVDRKGKHVVRIPKANSNAVLHKANQTQVLASGTQLTLKLGEWIDYKTHNTHYLIRPVIEPKVRPYSEPEIEQTQWRKFFGGSVIGHFLIILLLGVFALFNRVAEPEVEPEFVQIDLASLIAEPVVKLEPKPEPPPEPVEQKVVPKPEPKPEQKTPPKPAPAPAPKPVAEPPKDVGGGSKDGGNVTQRNVQATGLLAALGTTSATKPNSNVALAQVTNLDAIESPSSSGLKVAGLSAKVEGVRTTVPTGELVNSAGKDGVLRSGGLAGDGNLAALERGQTGQGAVQATVSASLSKHVKVEGGISRAAVKAVIDAHLSEVTFCYESALAYDPNLSGKIAFEWTILTNGRVGSVGIESSTVQSNAVHNCVQAAIRTWQFPSPKGAEVEVSYPFVFDMVGF